MPKCDKCKADTELKVAPDGSHVCDLCYALCVCRPGFESAALWNVILKHLGPVGDDPAPTIEEKRGPGRPKKK